MHLWQAESFKFSTDRRLVRPGIPEKRIHEVAEAYPRRKLHIVRDNYSTHNHPDAEARQAIRRGSFSSIKDLITAIENFIDDWNDRCHPFT